MLGAVHDDQDAEPGWGVVVPVKALAGAKSRLRPFGDDSRRALALAMAGDVLESVAACPLVRVVLVVSTDPDVAALARALGAQVDDAAPDGLNPALEHGAARLRAADPRLGVAALAGDLPGLRPDQLAAALAQVGPGARAFVADAPGTGTSLLAAGPGAALLPAYGPGSRQRHLDSGAAELAAAAGLRLDVDTPADLRRALDLGVGARTAAAAADAAA
jgi:2-phospho-L-lactate guanylyltransferase